ncbi:MAG: hypothetical protein AXA67_00945 [Methylothermaceae bacteria B42]|nr:MAG: hypothetical protein AXA67_00945 [Methylothermaceae bacteria B42]HHJ38231.1 hypothetical protein [Methylothermaceae bacterium]
MAKRYLKMKQITLSLILLSVSMVSIPVNAQQDRIDAYDAAFTLLDVLVYRPVGIVATIAGTGLFTAMIPLTAIAQIAPPHDAFAKTANILIDGPARYTFRRPVGDSSLARY